MFYQKLLFCLVAFVFSTVFALPGEDGRIVTGTVIDKKQAPFMVRVLNPNSFCGGTLVAPSYVVTAAHCVNPKTMKGITIVSNVTAITDKGIRRKVVNMQIHPDWKSATIFSDVAVLQLDKPIENIGTLPLCSKPLEEGNLIRIFGWGRIKEGGAKSAKLRTATVPVRARAYCESFYGPRVLQNMFCASGSTNIGVCRGDSGGPAVFDGELCGITSFTYKCGSSPDGFTDVYALRSFIESAMANVKKT